MSPYTASLVNLDVSETRRTGSGQAAAGELVSVAEYKGLAEPQHPHEFMHNLDLSKPKNTAMIHTVTIPPKYSVVVPKPVVPLHVN